MSNDELRALRDEVMSACVNATVAERSAYRVLGEAREKLGMPPFEDIAYSLNRRETLVVGEIMNRLGDSVPSIKESSLQALITALTPTVTK